VVGLVTMLGAAWLALRQTDLKKILAYSTVSVLGILTALLGLGTELAIKAMVVFLVAHALYKAALFMVAGIVDHQAGTRDAGVLAGLGKLMPFTAAAGLLAAVSKAGAPPMFGFVGKELLYKAKLDLEVFGEIVVLIAVLTNIALVATALLVGVKPFWGRRLAEFDSVREAPAAMLIGPIVLGLLGIFVGLVPASFDALLGGPMASAIVGSPVEMKLALWYGLNPSALAVLGLSILTLLAGVLLYVRVLHRGPGQLPGPPFTLESSFERVMDGLPYAAGRLTNLVHGGTLRRDLGIAAIVAATLVLAPLASHIGIPGLPELQLTAVEVAALVLIVAGAVAALAAHGTLRALLGLGSTGLGISLLFLLLGAPDLALTQLMVETLTVVLLAVVLLRLPDRHQFSTPRARVRDGIIAAAVGLAVGLTILVAGEVRLQPGIAQYFAEASVPEAKGRNIVNVILVDFRALDTLGETVVLALAGVGILALLRARGLRPRKEDSA
jgi:multicomponent Na+:H+ antiporter subunit A